MYLCLGRHLTGDSGFADKLGESTVRTKTSSNRVVSSRPEVVLSIDRACVPHNGGQHRNEETRSQPHDKKRASSLVELKAEGMLVSR